MCIINWLVACWCPFGHQRATPIYYRPLCLPCKSNAFKTVLYLHYSYNQCYGTNSLYTCYLTSGCGQVIVTKLLLYLNEFVNVLCHGRGCHAAMVNFWLSLILRIIM